MENSETIEAIDPERFDKLLSEYPNVVPKKLSELDKQRYEVIPKALEKQASPTEMTKDQISTLVDWKLSHGKFRPALKGLVQQNPADVVQSHTGVAFIAFKGSSESAKASLRNLTDLKGIGPATASLILSVYDPETAPFFSDELFRWCFFESAKGQGWDRSIKYNVKEYLQLFDKVQELRRRFRADYERDVAAVDIEKVAYVLGQRSNEASANGVEESKNDSLKRKASSDEEASQEPKKAAISSTVAKTSEPMRPPKSRAGSRTSARVGKK